MVVILPRYGYSYGPCLFVKVSVRFFFSSKRDLKNRKKPTIFKANKIYVALTAYSANILPYTPYGTKCIIVRFIINGHL